MIKCERGVRAEQFITFRNEFDTFNNKGARMLDSIYHMVLKLREKWILGWKTSRFFRILYNVIM